MNLNPNSWYALRVRTRWEKQVSELLRLKGYETFSPVSRSRRRWSDRTRFSETSLFPGYVFCRPGAIAPGLALTTPGVMHFVGFGRSPSPVDEIEIVAIQQIVSATEDGQPWPHLRVGERVDIQSGPLAGLSGFLVSASADQRFVVGVTLLQRSLAVRLCASWIVAAAAATRNPISRHASKGPLSQLSVARGIGP